MDSTMFGPAYHRCAALYMEHHSNSAYNKFKSWWGMNMMHAISKELDGKKRKRNSDAKTEAMTVAKNELLDDLLAKWLTEDANLLKHIRPDSEGKILMLDKADEIAAETEAGPQKLKLQKSAVAVGQLQLVAVAVDHSCS